MLGAQIAARMRQMAEGWPSLRFGRMSVETHDAQHHFSVEVQLGALERQAVRVELYADGLSGAVPLRQEMKRTTPGNPGIELYVASVPASHTLSDYTARIVPALQDGSVPLEAAHILWQH